MNSNNTSRTAPRKGFPSFGVLSPQHRVEPQALATQLTLERKVQPRAAFKVWRVHRYET